MPASNRTFNYTLIPQDPGDTERVLKHTTRWLGRACDGDKRITCHEVAGDALGAVTMSMTIRARDRWWAAQLAQDVLNHVLWGLEHSPDGLGAGAVRLDLQSERQAPHGHRGYAHGRTKRYRERKKAQATDAGAENEFTRSGGTSSATTTGTSTDSEAPSGSTESEAG